MALPHANKSSDLQIWLWRVLLCIWFCHTARGILVSKGHLESLETKESKGNLGPTDHLANLGNRAFMYASYNSQISRYKDFNIKNKIIPT